MAIAGSNPAYNMEDRALCLLGAATGQSLDQKIPTECAMSECDVETSTMR